MIPCKHNTQKSEAEYHIHGISFPSYQTFPPSGSDCNGSGSFTGLGWWLGHSTLSIDFGMMNSHVLWLFVLHFGAIGYPVGFVPNLSYIEPNCFCFAVWLGLVSLDLGHRRHFLGPNCGKFRATDPLCWVPHAFVKLEPCWPVFWFGLCPVQGPMNPGLSLVGFIVTHKI